MVNRKFSKSLGSQIASKFPGAVFLKETDKRIISLTIDDEVQPSLARLGCTGVSLAVGVFHTYL